MTRRALVLLALPFVAAACGGGGDNTGSRSNGAQLSPAASVKKAAAKTAQAQSEHIAMTAVTAVQGQQVRMTGSGDFDNAKKSGTLTMHANIAGVDMQIDAVMDGTTMYMKAPLFAAALPKGKTWMKIDLQKAGKSQGIDFSSLLTQNPADQFQQLQAAGAMKEIGDETVDGVATTHYRGRINPSKVPQGAQIQKVTKAKYGPYDVWVGKDDGYVHKMKTSYSTAVAGNTALRMAATTTMIYSDFGEDVTVNVPPPSDTFDATNQSMGG